MSMFKTFTRAVTLGRSAIFGLPREAAQRDPLDLFGEWFDAARRSDLPLPESMCLATCTADGVPSARMVLLKGFDKAGFVFYTNYGSRKARELDDNPRAALVFHWNNLQRQVRIEGVVTRVTAGESADYFRTRPHGSRIGAWASRQSEPVRDRDDLHRRFKQLSDKFGDGEVPAPDFWGGYRLQHSAIEFWQGRANRLHDRLRFTRDGPSWNTQWLQP